ncbi:hypothetical protein KSS87_020001 [Heliosperma pusillum]|nr:hypothetical protein KSS87_020001 [Heliosperma pusillum]
MGLPIIGETYDFLSTGWKGHPEKFIINRLSKYEPSEIFKTSILGEKVVVMCGAACNKFLFSNENKLVVTWMPTSLKKIFLSSGKADFTDAAKKLRKILPTFFNPRALQRYISIMDKIAIRHMEDEWEGKDKVEVFSLAKRYTFWLLCRIFLSIEDPVHLAKFAVPFNDIISGIFSIPIDLPRTPFNRGIKASNVVRRELGVIIKQRKLDLADNKASPTQDILSHMLLTTDEDGQFINESDIANNILGLLVGGHDTVSAVLMRLTPPTQGTFREALSDFMYDGFQIPKGWKLFWTAYSTNRNPEYFPEPEKFDSSRFDGSGPAPYTFVPFGGGPRICPGKEFAKLEILVFMHNIVKRFKWEKLIPEETIVLDPTPAPARGLPVRLRPHRQSSLIS